MSDEYGSDFITLTGDDGEECELEHLDTLELDGGVYMAFLPADMDEDDPNFGLIMLKAVEEDGEEVLVTIDDEVEKNIAFEAFMLRLFDGEEEELE